MGSNFSTLRRERLVRKAWELASINFSGGRKTGEPEEKPSARARTRTNNKPGPHKGERPKLSSRKLHWVLYVYTFTEDKMSISNDLLLSFTYLHGCLVSYGGISAKILLFINICIFNINNFEILVLKFDVFKRNFLLPKIKYISIIFFHR